LHDVGITLLDFSGEEVLTNAVFLPVLLCRNQQAVLKLPWMARALP